MEIIILLSICLGVLLVFGILAICNEKLPRWFCDKLKWHLQPKGRDFNGHHYYGKCPRCKKIIYQTDSGVWNELPKRSKLKIR